MPTKEVKLQQQAWSFTIRASLSYRLKKAHQYLESFDQCAQLCCRQIFLFDIGLGSAPSPLLLNPTSLVWI